MDITALFDDVDTAEHALVNLQSLGIFPSRYKIRALHLSDDPGRGGVFVGNMNNAVEANGFGANNMTVPGFAAIGLRGGPGAAFGRSEPPSGEVQLLLTVDEDTAHRAQSVLVSNHGRRVRMTT
ncbi:MAG: hypothetical protein FWG31_02430 [Oscillospiraceae bacterium]|nr:hypothetical protein [Oscillospiraceae bacterium]